MFKFEKCDTIHFPLKVLLKQEAIFRHTEMFNPERFEDEKQLESIENFLKAIQCPMIIVSLDFITTFLTVYLTMDMDSNSKK